MPATTPEQKPETAPKSTHYRLIVRSAAEAVETLRKRFGERGKVISVRQVEAGGLGRFLQRPKLEVIVAVEEGGSPESKAGTAPQSASGAKPTAPSPESKSAEAEPTKGTESVSHDSERSPEDKASVPEVPRRESSSASRMESLLLATGFDRPLVERIRAENGGPRWDAMNMHDALTRVCVWLRGQAEAGPRTQLTNRRVFFGGYGTGKTTALCKILSADVFLRQRQPSVLKLDVDQPNPTDGLAAFCDILGVPLLRSAVEALELDTDALLYVDLPGMAANSGSEVEQVAKTLDSLQAETRVLVLNAAYESEILADSYRLGHSLNATHVVFTHLDEVRRPGKLWKFLLFSGLKPLFFSKGPNLAGDIEEDVYSSLLDKTFPQRAVNGGREAGSRPKR